MKVAFVTNFCPHYRIRTFEMLSKHHDVTYYFYSAGDEWYWQQQHGTKAGAFRYEYLPGFALGAMRIVVSLPLKLWRGNHDVYVKCINGRFSLPATFAIARLRRKPFVLWTGIWMRLDTPAHRALFAATRYIYTHADAVVTYGEHVRRYLLDEGVAEDRIFVAPHAVDNDAYNQTVSEVETNALREQLGISNGQSVILYLGRLEEVKGLPYLLEAYASLPPSGSVLLIAGDGSERDRLHALVQGHGMADRVRFAGYVLPDQAARYYALASVLVLPSVTLPSGRETWGLVVNEAMNQGLPVVATDAVGAAAGGLVENGVTGFVVPERDSERLAAALRLILYDEALRTQLGANARERIAAWNNEQMVAGFLDAVDSAAARRRG